MTNYLILLSLLLFYQIVEKLACWGSNRNHKLWDQYMNKVKNNHSVWDVPDNLKEEYKKWFVDYMTKKNESKIKERELGLGEPPKGMSIPKTWKGYGEGHSGQDPPPWAIVTEAYDKPDFCFLHPVYGPCQQRAIRWGYSSFHGQCQKFNYSGCGGNENNFPTKRRCEAICAKSALSGCHEITNYADHY